MPDAATGDPVASRTRRSDRSLEREILLSIGCRPGWLVVGTLVLASAVGLPATPPGWARYVPLAASLLVFGLPHGAVDHLAPARAAGREPTRRGIVAVGLTYLVLGCGYAALWTVTPAASAVVFVALTWVHWGLGDLYVLDTLGGARLDGLGVRAGTVLVRGGLPMLVPLLRYPDRYRAVIEAWVALFGRGIDASWVASPTVRVTLGGTFAAATVATLLAGRRHERGREWTLDVAETLLLWAYFLVVPPVVAVGTYFCVWHSLRHVARLIAVDPAARAAAATGDVRAALTRTGRDALPLTLVSVGLVTGVAFVVGVDADPRTLAALYLVFVAVLTLPHVVIVAWMDRVQEAGLVRTPG